MRKTRLILNYGPEFLLPPLLVFAGAAWIMRRPWPDFLKFLLLPLAIYLPLVMRQQELWRFMYRYSPAYYDHHVLGLMEATLRLHAKPVLREGALALHALTPEPL